jgi:transposase
MFFIGIDVHKKKLDVVVLLEPDTLKKRHKKVPNPPEGFQTLITWCQKQTGTVPAELHAVMEATGPYHEALAHALHDAGLVVSVINPKAVKDFAKGLGIKAKNDAMDALTIARFGVLTKPRPWQPEPADVRHLSALLKRLAAVEPPVAGKEATLP